jgi:hypothetical protein
VLFSTALAKCDHPWNKMSPRANDTKSLESPPMNYFHPDRFSLQDLLLNPAHPLALAATTLAVLAAAAACVLAG